MHDDSNIRSLRGKDGLHLVEKAEGDMERRVAGRSEGDATRLELVPDEVISQPDDLDPSVRELPISAELVKLRSEWALLRQEHKDLDESINALTIVPQPDQILIARLKRKKLFLRDQIAKIEDKIRPDIIA
ncbi:DUF465 domain-containing protein [Asticcacaulis sp. EMRT-3]|uniref:YdcH family protein n=1 Tax=Asticcacaulis sp. EMRT-3 TaxID=3040349 RepID=UPI0024AFD039|nr:DUF465 domain-containing protein [Asticcacaulis sp. EMRT-3]MDI7775178.1 DUF465 domain-containing protein [Asticcacaulis sp. EMRT-3]